MCELKRELKRWSDSLQHCKKTSDRSCLARGSSGSLHAFDRWRDCVTSSTLNWRRSKKPEQPSFKYVQIRYVHISFNSLLSYTHTHTYYYTRPTFSFYRLYSPHSNEISIFHIPIPCSKWRQWHQLRSHNLTWFNMPIALIEREVFFQWYLWTHNHTSTSL